MLQSRPPRPALRPFVKMLWTSDGTPDPAARELSLPTGTAHLAFSLSEQPFRFFDGPDGSDSTAYGHAVLGGPRASPYVKDTSEPVGSVGAWLRPGAARALAGVPAFELADRHTRLEDLWGRSAEHLREQLLEAPDPGRALDVLEDALAGRLPRVRAIHPAVAHALDRFRSTAGIGEVVTESGYSHRRFLFLFRGAVGLTPKLYCRVLRLQRVLEHATDPSLPLVSLALGTGFSDQPHLNRDFRQLAGISPGRYRRISPARRHHVPLE